MEIWLQAAGEYGFPMTITFYLLYRMEKKLDTINRSILSLAAGRSMPAAEISSPPALDRETHIN